MVAVTGGLLVRGGGPQGLQGSGVRVAPGAGGLRGLAGGLDGSGGGLHLAAQRGAAGVQFGGLSARGGDLAGQRGLPLAFQGVLKRQGAQGQVVPAAGVQRGLFQAGQGRGAFLKHQPQRV